jgi:hypothetical protein
MSQFSTDKQILELEPVLIFWASTSNPNIALQLERNYLYPMGSTGTFYPLGLLESDMMLIFVSFFIGSVCDPNSMMSCSASTLEANQIVGSIWSLVGMEGADLGESDAQALLQVTKLLEDSLKLIVLSL